MLANKVPGIYKIQNIVNLHSYIGSAVNINNRWSVHVATLNRGTHHCRHLQNAWNKYGKDNFLFSIIETCNKEELVVREQYWLDALSPEYNIARYANSSQGIEFSPERRAKISQAQLRLCEDPEERQFRSDKAKAQWSTPGIMDGVLDKLHAGATAARKAKKRSRLSNALKAYYATLTPEEKRQRSLRQLAAKYNNPGLLKQ